MFLNDDNTRLTPEGTLEISIKAAHQQCLYIRAWDQGLDVYVNDIDGEVNVFRIDPGIPILSLASESKAGSDLFKFTRGIPTDFRLPATKLVFNQTLVLQWAARFAPAGDLLVNNPVLLWLLVDAAQRRYWNSTYVERILALRQPEIVGELIGSASKRAVRFLRKIELKEADKKEYGFVMWGLQNDEVLDATRHLTSIPVQILAMLFYVPELMQINLVQMIASSISTRLSVSDAIAEASRIHRIQQDTVNLGRLVKYKLAQQPWILERNVLTIIGNCRSVQQLDQLHDTWTDQLNKNNPGEIEKCNFPAPPLAGTESIVPITNNLDLLDEGREMQHCVGGYSDMVLNGKCYVYKVLQPQRATLEVRIRGSYLAIEDLRAHKNGSPTRQCRKFVETWLHPERDIT